jgi:hypothetical protein
MGFSLQYGILEQSMGGYEQSKNNQVVVSARQPKCSLVGRHDNPIPTLFLAP